MMPAVSFVGDERNDKGETSVKFMDDGECCFDEDNVLVIFFDNQQTWVCRVGCWLLTLENWAACITSGTLTPAKKIATFLSLGSWGDISQTYWEYTELELARIMQLLAEWLLI